MNSRRGGVRCSEWLSGWNIDSPFSGQDDLSQLTQLAEIS